MKKRILSILLSICILCGLLSGCSNQDLGNATLFSPIQQDAVAEFDALTKQWMIHQLSSDPLSCHYSLANPQKLGISLSKDSFCDLSYEHFVATQKEQADFLNALKDIPYHKLPSDKQLIYDLLVDYYSLQGNYDEFYYYNDPLSPTSGIPASLPVLLSGYSFRNKEDISLYLQLLDDIDIYFEQLYHFASEKKEVGLLQNYTALKQTAEFCKNYGTYDTSHMLLTSFQERISDCTFLTEEEKQRELKQNSHLIHDVVLPSYLSLSSKLASLCENEDGTLCLCHVKNGRCYYRLLIQSATGCEDSPFLLFQKISKHRDKDMKEMASYLAKDPSLASRMSNSICPLQDPSEMLEVLQTSIQSDFPSCPSVDYQVKEISPEVRKYSAPAYYLIAPADNIQNHEVFYNPDSFSSNIELFTTMAHEGFPGHLYQTCLTYQSDYEPIRLLLSYPGYVEGWATYVESLSYQYAGLPEDVSHMLSLNQSILLSLYATSDIGIHYYGWDLQALEEFLAKYGIENKKVAENIYNLILNDPANYLKYYVGYLNFVDMREEFEKKYPSSFSPMDFHRIIVETGPVPFSILHQRLENYFSKRA